MGFFRTMINGTSPAPGEVWSIGLSWIGPNTEIPFEDLREWAEGIGTAINAFTNNGLVNLLSSSGFITSIRTEQRDETTEALIQAAEFTLLSPEPGAGTPSKTLQTSLCISLLTGRPGRSFRGRVYWPAWAYSGTTEMRFGTTNLGTYLTGFDEIHNLIQAQAVIVNPAYSMVLAVRSRLLHESNSVQQYAAGNVPDTQRRRRDALEELYVLLDVNP